MQSFTSSVEQKQQKVPKMQKRLSGDAMNTSQNSGYNSDRSQEQYGQEIDNGDYFDSNDNVIAQLKDQIRDLQN